MLVNQGIRFYEAHKSAIKIANGKRLRLCKIVKLERLINRREKVIFLRKLTLFSKNW